MGCCGSRNAVAAIAPQNAQPQNAQPQHPNADIWILIKELSLSDVARLRVNRRGTEALYDYLRQIWNGAVDNRNIKLDILDVDNGREFMATLRFHGDGYFFLTTKWREYLESIRVERGAEIRLGIRNGVRLIFCHKNPGN